MSKRLVGWCGFLLFVLGLSGFSFYALGQDMAATSDALSPNLVENGDFETLTDGWAFPWRRSSGTDIAGADHGHWLVLSGPNVSSHQDIALRPEWWTLRLSMRMRVSGVVRGDEGWKDGRLAMSFHAEDGTRVGNWPNVFNAAGSSDWVDCERLYAIPRGAVTLRLNPANFGTAGTVEFDDIEVVVTRTRPTEKSDAPLPDGVQSPWNSSAAWREDSGSQGKLCINGLWRFRPVVEDSDALHIPAPGDCWGWFKVPGIWPRTHWSLTNAAQQVRLAPWHVEGVDLRQLEQAWYKRSIRVPETWKGREVFLQATMLQTHASVWLDGQEVGELWYPGGRMSLTSAVRAGHDQELVLLVTARPLSSQRRDFMAPDRVIASKASVKLRGIPGDLFLTSAPARDAVEDVHVITSVSAGTVTFDVGVARPSHLRYRLRAEVFDGDTLLKTFDFDGMDLVGGRLSYTGRWGDAPRWDTHTPGRLLDARVQLLDDAGTRLTVSCPVRFGFREFSIDGRFFRLNGTPIHLRALHNRSANGFADRACRSSARRTIERMQQYGFNFLILANYNLTPGELGYLDGLLNAADETGMLVSVSLPHVKDFGWALEDPPTAARFRRLTEWMVRRVQNHPSVVMYAMTHNATGYYGDQNPLKIDGIYDPDAYGETLGYKGDSRRSERRHQARLAEAIARGIDASRPIYHHQSGHLGELHTVNIYLNWAPKQERSDWLAHWATAGRKPVFFVEWGLPHISSWSSYRGPQFIWRCKAFQSLWIPEYAAAQLGTAAYNITPSLREALDYEEELWARGEPFPWGTLAAKAREEPMHVRVMAMFAADNWRCHRAWGASAMLPWDQGEIWQRRAPTAAVQQADRFADLQRPGIVPDTLQPDSQYIYDPGPADAFAPSHLGEVFLRWNRPLCAFIGGRTDGHGPDGPVEDSDRRFTEKSHNVHPGDVLHKSLVVINDSRTQRTCSYTWTLGEGAGAVSDSGQVILSAGDRTFIPLTFQIPDTARAGTWTLAAAFDFGAGERQRDSITLDVLPPEDFQDFGAPVWLIDPVGQTAAWLDEHCVAYRVCSPAGEGVEAGDVVVIGEKALSHPALANRPMPLAERIGDGLRVLVLAQEAEVLSDRLGFRVNVHGLRQLYVRSASHPVLRGLTDRHVADWAGASEMVPPTLDVPAVEPSDPTWLWCGFRNTRVWRCGTLGAVSSILIEKPPRGLWRPLLDGGFDLQYAPLLETVVGQGRLLLCQLDLIHRTEADPVADRILDRSLIYLEKAPAPRRKRVYYTGDPCGARLLADLGVDASACPARLESSENLLVVAGPGAAAPDGWRQFLASGASLLCLDLDADTLATLLPEPPRTERMAVRSARLPAGGDAAVLRGISAAEVNWKTHPELHVLSGEGHPALRTFRVGEGRAVVCQSPPWVFNAVGKPYLRTTERRSRFLVSRLLDNLGAASESPLCDYLGEPAPMVSFDLPDDWVGQVDRDDRGRDELWWAPGHDDRQWQPIEVPGTFDSQVNGLADYDGLFWYRLRFRLPEKLPHRDLMLHLGGIDDESWVWFNGRFLGEVTQSSHPDDYWRFAREYPLGPEMLSGTKEQVLAIRVKDTYRTGGIMGIPRISRPARWLRSYYVQVPEARDDPYRYYRW